MSHCINIKGFTPKSTTEQNDEAKEWFDEYSHLSGVKYEDLRDIVNSDARADYFNGAIRLFSDGEYSDLYHEAFHDFSQNHLTKEQKESMYKEAEASREGKKTVFEAAEKAVRPLSDSEKFNALEEMLAKDFHDYKKTGKTFEGRQKRNSIFRKMWEWLKDLFGKGTPSIDTLFQNLGNLDFAKFKRGKDNAFFGKLNKAIDGLSFKDTMNLYKGLDSFLAEQFREQGVSISRLFKDKKAIENAYHNMLAKLNVNRDHWTDRYNEEVDRYQAASPVVKKSMKTSLSNLKRLVDNLEFVTDNWNGENGVRAMHLKESQFLKISKQFVPEEIINELEPDSKDGIYDDKEEQSVRDKASDQLIYLLASLPKYQFVGGIPEPKPNDFLDIIDDVTEFDKAWNTLAKALTGERDYGRMWEKIKSLAKSNPEYHALLQSLPSPNTPGNEMSLLDTQLVTQFVGVFSQPLVDRKIINFWKDEQGNLRVYAKPGVSKSLDRLKEDWRDGIQELDNEYRILDPETGQYHIDIERISTDFENVEKSSKRNKEKFLSALGLNLSPTTLESPEYKDLLESSPIIKRIYTALSNYVALRNSTHPDKAALAPFQREEIAKPVLSILDALSNTIYGRDKQYIQRTASKPKLVTGQKEAFEELAEMELKYSDKFFSDNVVNSEGNSVYSIRPWSQQTVMYNLLNDPSFQDYNQLINTPLGAYFDFSKNPDADNIFVNALFDVATGKRKTDSKGKPVKINLYNHDGWNINTKEGDEVGENIGSKTIRLERFEKLVQDISALLLFGSKEHLRYGDKSTSNGTETTFDRLTEGSKEQPFLPVAMSDFKNTHLPKEAKAVFKKILYSALKLTNDYFGAGIGKNFDNFHQNMLKKEYWGFFDAILSKDTKDKLLEEGLITDPFLDINKAIDTHIELINRDLESFLKKDSDGLLAELRSNTVLEPKDYISHDLLQDSRLGETDTDRFETAIRAFAVNSYILNTEHVRLMFQDPRFYDNKKGTYKEIFKRLSKASSTGTIAVNNEQINAFLTKNGRLEREQYNKEHPDSPIPILPENGIENTAIFGDVAANGEDFLEALESNFPDASPEEIQALRNSYGKIDATDAFGFCTMDFARIWEIRTGDDNWNNEKESLYGKMARGEEIPSDGPKEIIPQIKIRQAGYVYDSKTGRFAPIDYKLSLMPLLPTLVKGKAFAVIRDNMLRQNVSIGTFKTASKHSSITNEGKHNSLFDKDGNVNKGDYTINPIHLEYTFEVVASPEHFKEESTYPTQRRKLLFSNSFEGGVPIDYKGSNWNDLSEVDKLDKSSIYRLEQSYGQHIEKLINLGKNRLLKSLDASEDEDGNFTINDQKFSDLLEKEFKNRNLPNNAQLSVQTVNGKFKFALDASLLRETIEQVLISIVDNRLRKQKTTGEGLIMASSIGSDALGFNRVDAWKSVDGSDLPFYKKDGRTLADGTKVTSAMKIKIALQGDFKKLLNHPDVKALVSTGAKPLDALNNLLKDESWLDKGENRAMISVNGDKIPIQGLNSMEFMEVQEFLPEEAGPVVIMSAGWVAKTGGDFDWDKNSARFPRISNRVTLYKPLDAEQRGKLVGKQKHLLNKFNSTVDKLADQDVIAFNLQEELETYTFNLFDDDDDIVQEAKTNLDRVLRSIPKLEVKGDELGEQIQALTDLAEEMDDKAAFQNEIGSIERNVLERSDLYDQLVTPNSTFMFEPIADARQAALAKNEAIKPSYSKISTVQESLNQFESNTVGRQSLGIGAIWNTFFAQLQKAGVTLEHTYISNPAFPKYPKTTTNRLPHNKIKGKISVSGIYSRNYKGTGSKHTTKYRISDTISQLMNGWVDVAKKDWVFYINGVKEIAPKMLFAACTGIHKDVLVGFFNQPILSDYIKNLANYKSDIVKLQHPAIYKNAGLHAIYETIKKWLPEETQILTRQKKNPLQNAMELLNTEMAKLQSTDSKKAGLAAAFAYGHLNYGFRELANQNTEQFEPEKFMKFAIPNKDGNLDTPETPEEKLAQVLYLIQYLEFKEQQGIMDNVRRTLTQDTTKPENLQDSKERQVDRANLKDYGLVTTQHVNRMADESTIRGFTSSRSGIDKFLQHLTDKTFEVTNHRRFNRFLYDEFNQPAEKNNIPFDKRFEIWPDWVKSVKNDFILYLYQNYVYKPGTLMPVVQDVKGQLKYKTALALDLEAIKRNHPDLVKNNLLLDFLIRDNSREKLDNKPRYVSIKLKKARLDSSTSNVLTEAFDELYNFPDPEISQFARKLGRFSFIQSGLTKSDISFSTIIPQEVYGEDMSKVIEAFGELLNNAPDQAQKEIEAFYNRFKKNNRKFFKANLVNDAEDFLDKPDIRFASETKRFKDYTNPNAFDLLSKKLNIAILEEQASRDAMKKKVTQDNIPWTKETAKHDPKNFYIYEINESGGGQFGSSKVRGSGSSKNTLPNTAGIVTMQKATATSWLSDDSYDRNVAQIDASVDTIVAQILDMNPEKIFFPVDLFQVSKLNEKAPKTFAYLAEQLRENFGYNIEPKVEEETKVDEPEEQREREKLPAQTEVDKPLPLAKPLPKRDESPETAEEKLQASNDLLKSGETDDKTSDLYKKMLDLPDEDVNDKIKDCE